MTRPTRSLAAPLAAPSGDTPWLLFVGILIMALVPAMFSQQKVREFQDKLEGYDKTTDAHRDQLGQHKHMIGQVQSIQAHHKQRVLPKLAKDVAELSGLPPKVHAAERAAKANSEGLASLAGHVEELDQRLPRMLKDADARLAMLEKQIKTKLSNEAFTDATKELARSENMRKLASDNLKSMQDLMTKSLDDYLKKIEEKYEPFVKKLQGKNRAFATREELTSLVKALQATRKLLQDQKQLIDDLKKELAKQTKLAKQADENAKAIAAIQKQLAESGEKK